VLKVGAASMSSSLLKMIFIKNIKLIFLRFHPLSTQAGKPVPPDSLGGDGRNRVGKTLLQEAKKFFSDPQYPQIPLIKAEWFSDFFAKTRQQLLERIDQALLWVMNRPDGNKTTCSLGRFM
jgi:hypothetical protein